MNEMIHYIFGSLQASENSIKNIRKMLRNQAKTNRMVMTFALVVTAYAIVMEIRNSDQNLKIEKLSNKLEELKRMKGD